MGPGELVWLGCKYGFCAGNGMLYGGPWGGMGCVFVMAWIIIPNILASCSFWAACICIANCISLERLLDRAFAKHSTVASSFVFFLFRDPKKKDQVDVLLVKNSRLHQMPN